MNFQRLPVKRDEKLVLATCYDFTFAKLLAATSLDAILVGDSVAMVCHGHPSTISATVEMMAMHTSAVRRGAAEKFIIGDLPFLSYRKTIADALDAAGALMKAGASAVKLEGVHGHEHVVSHLVESGIPVMGHLGLTPQHVNQFGGFRVQGTSVKAAKALIEDSLRLEQLGCFAIVLECIPPDVARAITEQLSIPTIGIGAGPETDGQILVLHDILGLSEGMKAKFVRHFLEGGELVKSAFADFSDAVRRGWYPQLNEAYACLSPVQSSEEAAA